jgi:hypothetical protein
MAIERRAVGECKGTKSEKQGKEKGADDAHLEEIVKHMKDEDTEESGEKCSGKKGADVCTIKNLPFLVEREKALQEIFSYGERWDGNERKTW